MQVKPPAAWGKVTGTVMDAGSGNPLGGATVRICTMYNKATGDCGPVTYRLKTDGAGRYVLWLNKGYSPLQIIAANDLYAQQTKIAKVTAGKTATLDFALRQLNPPLAGRIVGDDVGDLDVDDVILRAAACLSSAPQARPSVGWIGGHALQALRGDHLLTVFGSVIASDPAQIVTQSGSVGSERAPRSRKYWSGWRDSNPPPLRPELRARPVVGREPNDGERDRLLGAFACR